MNTETEPLAQDRKASTRSRLLNAAGEAFATHGYKAATVRDICAAASANIAAVNYHFGDKDGLYRETLMHAALLGVRDFPPAVVVAPDAPAHDRLRGFLVNLLHRLLSDCANAWAARLLMREIMDPTPALRRLCAEFLEPYYKPLFTLSAELLGPAASPERVRLTACSIVGQCLFYKHCRPALRQICPEQGYDAPALTMLADHIAEFSLAAIERMRREPVAA